MQLNAKCLEETPWLLSHSTTRSIHLRYKAVQTLLCKHAVVPNQKLILVSQYPTKQAVRVCGSHTLNQHTVDTAEASRSSQ